MCACGFCVVCTFLETSWELHRSLVHSQADCIYIAARVNIDRIDHFFFPFFSLTISLLRFYFPYLTFFFDWRVGI